VMILMADSNQNEKEKEFIRNEQKKRNPTLLEQAVDCISREFKVSHAREENDIIFAIPNEAKHLANWSDNRWFFHSETEDDGFKFKLDFLICEPIVFFADSLLNSYIYHLFTFLELIGPNTKIICISKEEHYAVQQRLNEAGFGAEYDVPFTHVCFGRELVKVEPAPKWNESQKKHEHFVWRFNPNDCDFTHTDNTRDMMVKLKKLVDELQEHGYYDMFSPMPSIETFAEDALNKALSFPVLLKEIQKLQEMNIGGSFKKGDQVLRKGQQCTITRIDFSIDPPACEVKVNSTGHLVGTELHFLQKVSLSARDSSSIPANFVQEEEVVSKSPSNPLETNEDNKIPAQRSLTPEEEMQGSRPFPGRRPTPPSRDPVRRQTPPQDQRSFPSEPKHMDRRKPFPSNRRSETPPRESEKSFPSNAPRRDDRRNPFPSNASRRDERRSPPLDERRSPLPSNASRRDDRSNPFSSKRKSRSPERSARSNPFPSRRYEKESEPLRREERPDPFPYKRDEPPQDQYERSPRKPPRGGNRARRKAGPGREDPLHRRAGPQAPFERERRSHSYDREKAYRTNQPSPPRRRYSGSRTPEQKTGSKPIRGRGSKRRAGYNPGRPRDVRYSPSPRNSPSMDDYYDDYDDDDTLSYDSETGDYQSRTQIEKKKARKPPPSVKKASARGTGGGRGRGKPRGRGRQRNNAPVRKKKKKPSWYCVKVTGFYRNTTQEEWESWYEDDDALKELKQKYFDIMEWPPYDFDGYGKSAVGTFRIAVEEDGGGDRSLRCASELFENLNGRRVHGHSVDAEAVNFAPVPIYY